MESASFEKITSAYEKAKEKLADIRKRRNGVIKKDATRADERMLVDLRKKIERV